MGEAQFFLGEFDAANRALEPLVRLPSAAGRTAAGLVGHHLFRDLGRDDSEVEKLLKRAGRQRDEYPVDLAELYVARGKFARAARILRAESRRGNSSAPILLGNLYSDRLQQNKRAERYYLRGVELGDAFSAYNLAAILSQQGRHSESQTWLKYAADHGDEKAQARMNEIGA